MFINTLSEQDVAKSHDNDVLIVDSPSAILKMERREDEPKFTAHVRRFFRRAAIITIPAASLINYFRPKGAVESVFIGEKGLNSASVSENNLRIKTTIELVNT